MHENATNGKPTAPDLPAGNGAAAPGSVWQYDLRTGWRRADDPLPPCGEHESIHDWLDRCGFGRQMDYSSGTSALSLAIYSDRHERFIVELGDTGNAWRVHLDGLPNLIALLNEVAPAVRLVAELEEREQREEERARLRRRGPCVYDARRRQMRYARAGE
jgi:hypothetical protein